MMLRKFFGVVAGWLVLVVGISAPGIVCAEQGNVPEEKTAKKQVTGVIENISKHGIAVAKASHKDKQSVEEIFVPLNPKEVVVQRARELGELRRGDTVSIIYEQKYRLDDEGDPVLLGAKATHIILEKKAPKDTMSSDNALMSGESPE